MSPEKLEKCLSDLREDQKITLANLTAPRLKDKWDKFAVVSTFISGVLLVAVGGFFTYFYQSKKDEQQAQVLRHQNRLQEIQAIGSLMPYVMSDKEDVKKMGLMMVRELASAELMAEMAKSEPSLASAQALDAVVASSRSTKEEKKLATEALDQIFTVRRDAVVKITAMIEGRRIEKSGFLVTSQGHILTVDFALTNNPGQREIRATDVLVTTLAKKNYPAQILGMSAENGVALLKINLASTTFLELSEKVPYLGQPVLIIGYTGNEFLTRMSGEIKQVTDQEARYDRERASVPGFGGGPVLDTEGRVLGINWGALNQPASPGTAKFIRAERVRKFLSSIGLRL
jgi:S1-C subfamily serine protease